jgi:SpoVK/Ycf46/Vps4 family AAA+-type ATPase
LTAEFGASPFDGPGSSSLVVDDAYTRTLSQQVRIVEHQWRHGISRGMVRGFCLSGPPGTGKTTRAKLLGYELALRLSLPGADGSEVATVVVDGGDVATSKYGESERRIREIFEQASVGYGVTGRRIVIVFDDVESIFMSRDSTHAKEWHFSQDAVFFHAVDEMDTSRSIVVLTTNRPDLVDHAIRDRFLEYPVGYPPAALLRDVARQRAAAHLYSAEQLADLDRALRAAIQSGDVRSLRDVQHFTVVHYVSAVLGDRDVL